MLSSFQTVTPYGVFVIDLGPEGGDKGGKIVVAKTPKAVAEHSTSHPGMDLKQVLAQNPPEAVAA